ncbi:MAG: Ku protein [Burkholderiales bacterium]|jgi:DNA end-binding protein Ku|nr:Ku protein [Burkholderiales bacterium]
MLRPIWSGYISFGLVNIPVSLYSAQKRFDLRFHLLDVRDKSRVRYKRVNEETGAEVPWNKIVHGYEFTDGNYIVVNDEEFNKVSTTAKTIAMESFVNKEEIEYEFFETPYYLVPAKEGMKSYVLLREVLDDEGKLGIAKVAIHGREHVAAIMPYKNSLVLNLLRFYQELRPLTEFEFPEGTISDFKITNKELVLAKQLIGALTEKWQPENYHDDYREKLMKWVEDKTKTTVVEEDPVEKKRRTKSVDLIELMKKSMRSMVKKPAATDKASVKKKTHESRSVSTKA